MRAQTAEHSYAKAQFAVAAAANISWKTRSLDDRHIQFPQARHHCRNRAGARSRGNVADTAEPPLPQRSRPCFVRFSAARRPRIFSIYAVRPGQAAAFGHRAILLAHPITAAAARYADLPNIERRWKRACLISGGTVGVAATKASRRATIQRVFQSHALMFSIRRARARQVGK